jgi:hypothetical protein
MIWILNKNVKIITYQLLFSHLINKHLKYFMTYVQQLHWLIFIMIKIKIWLNNTLRNKELPQVLVLLFLRKIWLINLFNFAIEWNIKYFIGLWLMIDLKYHLDAKIINSAINILKISMQMELYPILLWIVKRLLVPCQYDIFILRELDNKKWLCLNFLYFQTIFKLY